MRYDNKFEILDQSAGGDVRVIGYFQSWKYFSDVRRCILNEFRFLPEYATVAHDFLTDIASKHRLSPAALYIGVHIRRGDMAYDFKYNVADARYFRRAVLYMTQKFPRRQLVFVVCSDEPSWAKRNFPAHVTVGIHGNETTAATGSCNAEIKPVVAFSIRHTAAEDLAILSVCNHTIMSVGSFGWWGGYLAGGITLYYRNFIRKGSSLMPHFSHDDYFPPEWVGL